MSYSLGVDLGNSFVAAAIARPSGVEMVTLAPRSVLAPALVYLRDNGSLVTGEVAHRRAASGPDRVAGRLKRRLGDPTPITLGSTPFPVTDLLGALLRSVLRQVVNSEGGVEPDRVVLTHPANWDAPKRRLFEEVPAIAQLAQTVLVTDAEAAAASYTADQPRPEGRIFAVYDLGGGTFDATILREDSDGVRILGDPDGLTQLGGLNFDETILEFVNNSSGALDGLHPTDLPTTFALAQLREACRVAKESLSLATEATVPVVLPDRQFEVRLTRTEFERMIRDSIESATRALHRTLRSANLEPSDLATILLVGGSSHIPLVARLITDEVGCPAAVHHDPQCAVAFGAATLAAAAGKKTGSAAARHPPPATSADRYDEMSGPALRGAHGGPSLTTPSVETSKRTRSPSTLETGAVTPQRRAGLGEHLTAAATAIGSAGARSGITDRATSSRTAAQPRSDRARPSTWSAIPMPEGGKRRFAISQRRLALSAAALLVAVVALLVFLAGGHSSTPPNSASATPHPAPHPVRRMAPSPPPEPAASVANPAVAATISVAPGPQAGAITPDGRFAYVTSTVNHSITLVDMATDAVVGTIPISAGPPQFVAFTPDGRHAYVSVYDATSGGATGANVVVEIDTATKAVVATIPAEKYPYAIAVSPDGRQLYIPNHDVNLVTIVDTATNTVVRRIPVKPNPHAVAFSTDGRRAYLANHMSNLVTVLDTSSGAIVAEIPVGHSPHSIAMSPDGSRVYVVNYDGNSVSVIAPATNTVSATIPVQDAPQSVAFAPDSKHAYVVNDDSDSVSVIDTATNQVTATVRTGQDPTDVFVAADGKHAYVTNISSNSLTLLNTSR